MTRVFILLICCFVLGCVNKDSIPANIIQKDSMRTVLLDMMVADQYSKQYFSKDTTKGKMQTETRDLYQQVFEIHHITNEDFKRSYQFYISRPDLARSLFDSVSAYANSRRREMYKPVLKPPVLKPAVLKPAPK